MVAEHADEGFSEFELKSGFNICFLDLGAMPSLATLGKKRFNEDDFRRYLDRDGSDKNQENFYRWKDQVVKQKGNIAMIASVVLPKKEGESVSRSILVAVVTK